MSSSVIVYTSSGCPHCHKVKEQLQEWGLAYEERNVSEVKEYFEELQAKRIFGTPATYIGGKPVLGFQPEKMKQRLEAAGIAIGGGSAAEGGAAAQGAADHSDAAGQPLTASGAEASQGSGSDSGNTLFGSVTADVLDRVYDLVVIGAGPAGASAAVYSARGRLSTLVIDKAPAAGTLATTHKIANYPGVRKEVTGLELVTEMQQHAHDFGASFVRSQVLSVDFSNPELKLLQLPEGTIRAKSVFIAVGAKAPGSKIKGEEEFTGRGVSYCSTCDAAFYQDRVVVVVGDNEEAIHEATALAKFGREVRLLVPGSTVKVPEEDLDEFAKLPNVQIYYKHRVKEIAGDESVDRVIVNTPEAGEQAWDVDGVFLYLAGMKPGTSFLGNAVELEEDGYVKVDELLRTSVDGVFAGGDARRTPIKQAVVSAADGCIAALGADQFINGRTKLRPQYA
ncbi:FAD-dependent oxidoreductase [Paenibacillus sp. y28]|uniref:FAD-dependent oxidoreductase n=1 Tax=Paenibacillus sp. y28 TaxID=3129110 RepID=UPI0030196C4E